MGNFSLAAICSRGPPVLLSDPMVGPRVIVSHLLCRRLMHLSELLMHIGYLITTLGR